MNFTDHLWNMSKALDQAQIAYDLDEVPVGSIVVDEKGVILAATHNQKEKNNNPCGHAELLGLIEAAKDLRNWRLGKCTLYTTLEPCLMCLGAMVHARISTLVFGAYDSKGGALSLNYDFYKDPRLNHNFQVVGGIRHYECSKILSRFFLERRGQYKVENKFK